MISPRGLLERDLIVPENIAWTHRQGEQGDIYFIANQLEETRTFTASMRIDGESRNAGIR